MNAFTPAIIDDTHGCRCYSMRLAGKGTTPVLISLSDTQRFGYLATTDETDTRTYEIAINEDETREMTINEIADALGFDREGANLTLIDEN